MDANCSKCATHIPIGWDYCAHCGTAVRHETHIPNPEHHAVRGAFGGGFIGILLAPILIFPGVLLCLLGWGIFLGVPMIILGILAPLAGPVFGFGEHMGKCPSCGTRVVGVSDGKGHSCPVCNADFEIEQHIAVKAN
jgi:hypothetical protein